MSNAKNLSFKEWILLERYPNIPTAYSTLAGWSEMWDYILNEYKQKGGLEPVKYKGTNTVKPKRIALNKS